MGLAVSECCCPRVEGRGKAVISDVVYSSKTTPEEDHPSPGSMEDYEALQVGLQTYN